VKRLAVSLCIVSIAMMPIAGCDSGTSSIELSERTVSVAEFRTYAQKVGTVFADTSWDQLGQVAIEEISIPAFSGGDSIWGALGCDDRGHIWFGVSGNSARLFEWIPDSKTMLDHGDVNAALKTAGLLRQGERQGKIHSHIQQADDGYLYFTSMDETSESWRTDTPPKWGSHLWRVRPETGRWEHVLSAPEGLIALHAMGRWVYALGYWNHVMYQYDTVSKHVRSRVVGSSCGHVSRNFIVDLRGHAYVPRIEPRDGGANQDCLAQELQASLVEFDTRLEEVAATPLEGYLMAKPSGNHGIISYSFLADGTAMFVTHGGQLYHLIPAGRGPAMLLPQTQLHPDENAYTASLFSVDGERFLAGVGNSKAGMQWIRYDRRSGKSSASALDLPAHKALLMYGSMARDLQGDFYVGGRIQDHFGYMRPILFRLSLQGGEEG